ncbi:MAG: 4-hydroxybenzoate octaprenyltransferase [Gammaproteobacteria bacterium]|nr:4-hydroxybenzoate octaprenyltransferase [Gammaproteobacteria bacterium]PCH64981.1 MAG: 4-hydroxybenzoate octaprenyltransferase [Gammaproteobacteria bacterium]
MSVRAIERWHGYARLMRLDKPIGILLLLWPTLWGLWVAAEGLPSWHILFVFVAGVVLMRSAGCVINDYVDRDFDGHVERTQARPLVSGAVTTKEALVLFGVLVIASFVLVLTLDYFTLALSVVALLLAVVYPFTKRYINIPQVVLGAAFAWAIPMAFAAIRGEIPLVAWLLFIATVLWAVAYDTFYAMVDREDDLRIGVKSTAILFGRYDRIIVAVLHGLVLAILLFVGKIIAAGFVYYMGIFTAILFAAYQQWLVRDGDKARCFYAFLNNNWFGLVIFLGIFLNFGIRSA